MKGVGRSMRAASNLLRADSIRDSNSARRFAGFDSQVLERVFTMENIACRIVVHVAEFADVPVESGDIQFIGTQDSACLVERPREVVAIVIEIDIGILRGIEAAAARGRS